MEKIVNPVDSIDIYTGPPIATITLKSSVNNRPVEVYSVGVSDKVGLKPLFTWRLSSFKKSASSEVYWNIRSSGRKSTVYTFLFHKWLFSNLAKEESELFFSLPMTISDPMIFAALRARSTGIPMKIIRQVLEKFSLILFNRKPPTYSRYVGYKTYVLQISSDVQHYTPKRLKAYSGWSRHHKVEKGGRSSYEDPYPADLFDENDNVSHFLLICKLKQTGEPEVFINNLRIKL